MIHRMILEGCAYTTIRHQGLVRQLLKHKSLFLAIRAMPQQVFVHHTLQDQVPSSREIQDGDGDVAFTG